MWQDCVAFVMNVAQTVDIKGDPVAHTLRVENHTGATLYVIFNHKTGEAAPGAANFTVAIENHGYVMLTDITQSHEKFGNFRAVSGATGRVGVLTY